MKMHRFKTLALATSVAASALVVQSVGADDLDKVFQVGQAKTAAAQKSQVKIDKISDQTRDRLQEYKDVLKQVEGLKVYIARLDRQIDNQNKRIDSIENSIEQVTEVKRQILPLVERMIAALDDYVALDVPFLLEERQQRVEFLRGNLDLASLTDAEKFRQVLEAYKIENEYGRKIEAYKDSVEIDGEARDVEILRIGRIGLLYQTTDAEQSGAWDQQNRQWVTLDNSQYKNAIRQGLRVAKKQASINIMTVPVAAPEAAK
ncbi:hypothetical protein SIN8267_02991 [Sinobacterium norvegicum]|uniref:t-SNARE coiled-coil homology domain-containing protein n=1 Tax=Sinobacterium norvegicum TaxID=1641715 RepID=A0ABN8EL86_9GAMM|nr:DUF3450 domain-containing protein [Sinobacterium norvegicum]CAH0992854.1 hypothetical protein SIN8267_02991 [Sinobacterium norvegicum]